MSYMDLITLIKSKGEGASDKKLDEAIEHVRKASGEAWLDITPYSLVTLWSTRIR